MNTEVDTYVAESNQWADVISALRLILLDSGLDEEIKWAKPCYTHDSKNIVIIQEMKDILALMFFKGALLEDTAGILEEQGPNSRSARRIPFTSTEDVDRLAEVVASYLDQAIQVEAAGLHVEPAPELVLVEELRHRLDEDPALKAAFETLTPGRRREYHLHISSAKQATTREARVATCIPKILAGKGFRDR